MLISYKKDSFESLLFKNFYFEIFSWHFFHSQAASKAGHPREQVRAVRGFERREISSEISSVKHQQGKDGSAESR